MRWQPIQRKVKRVKTPEKTAKVSSGDKSDEMKRDLHEELKKTHHILHIDRQDISYTALGIT
ncbi:MAG: hypothetical protein P1S60_05390 [Anaerolineae bacterium]|nr:hypothetical protein [Anaerolineae bacterium]